MSTNYQKNLATMILARLDVTDAAFNSSPEVRAALLNPQLRDYLRAWVLPEVSRLEIGEGEIFYGHASMVKSDALYVRAKREERKGRVINEVVKLYGCRWLIKDAIDMEAAHDCIGQAAAMGSVGSTDTLQDGLDSPVVVLASVVRIDENNREVKPS